MSINRHASDSDILQNVLQVVDIVPVKAQQRDNSKKEDQFIESQGISGKEEAAPFYNK